MPKNPHAVALGRKGGKAKGKPKGFAAMPAAKAKRIRALAAAARKAHGAGLEANAPAEVLGAVIALRTLTGIDLPAYVRRARAAEAREKRRK